MNNRPIGGEPCLTWMEYIKSLESELGHVRAERDGQGEGNDKLNRRNAELESKISGLREFFRTYGIANLDDFMEHAADQELMAGIGAECAKRTKEYVAAAMFGDLTRAIFHISKENS